MKRVDAYTTLKRETIGLTTLDAEERALIAELVRLKEQASSWTAYANAYMSKVVDLYKLRGLSRKDITATSVWKIAQDLNSRLMVEVGIARAPDYRDELEQVIQARFPNRRAFCEATGISEDMLSHVLARRKHLSIEAISEALCKIGYRIHIEPISEMVP